MIPLILLHIALNAQVGTYHFANDSIVCDLMSDGTAKNCVLQTGATLDQVVNIVAQVDDALGLANRHEEHIIEIRTKREVDQECWKKALEDVRICTSKGHDPCIAAHAYEFGLCEKFTKTLWIDGQRWGVIREIEEK